MNRNCGNCVYRAELQLNDDNGQPVIGQKALACHFSPPVPVFTPVGRGNVALQAFFPPVSANVVCAQHMFDDEGEQ